MATIAAAGFLVLDPPTVDMAAHTFRAWLFEEQGFALWNGQWYGGHHTPAYSVLFPPLAAAIGPAAVGAVAAVVAALLFDTIARRYFGDRGGRAAALWFAAGTATMLFTGRVTFALGVALGLGALLALQRGRTALAVGVAPACALASPIAALFLALCGAATALAGPERRLAGAAMGAAALAPVAALALLFPEGGREPFFLSAFLPVAAFAIAAAWLLPPSERALRAGVALYALGCTAALLIDTPVGGNAARLGALAAGPVVAGVAAGRGLRRPLPRVVMAAALTALTLWQWAPAGRDTSDALSDPAAGPAYFRPLVTLIEQRHEPPGRVEVVFTKSHWEASAVARHVPIARGWQRQLDIRHNGVFYEPGLDAARYETWLRENGVALVALADAEPDYSARRERDLVRGGLSYLRPAGRAGHWRVYSVHPRPPMVTPRSGAAIDLTQLGTSSFTLRVRRPGTALVRVRWSRWWTSPAACLREAPGGWTEVTANRKGPIRVVASLQRRDCGETGV